MALALQLCPLYSVLWTDLPAWRQPMAMRQTRLLPSCMPMFNQCLLGRFNWCIPLLSHHHCVLFSAQKRRLVRQLNDANGRGTPEVATSGSFSTVGKAGRQRRKSGDGLINLLTPRRKRPPVTGSYSVQGAVGRPRREAMSSSSFRRQNSHPTTPLAPPRASLLSPSHLSSPAVLSPCRERLPSPTLVTTPNSQSSEVGQYNI